MASENPLRSARLPSPQQVTELLEAEFARAGYDVDDVVGASPEILVISSVRARAWAARWSATTDSAVAIVGAAAAAALPAS